MNTSSKLRKNLFLVVIFLLGFGLIYFFNRPTIPYPKHLIKSESQIEELRKNVNAGDGESAYNLFLHYAAIGNRDESQKWLKKSAILGYSEAQQELER